MFTATYENYILHPQFEGTDWSELKEGTPLFISATGCGDVINFNGAEHLPSQDTPRSGPPIPQAPAVYHAAFINEAAYQEKRIACALVKADKLTLY